MSAVLVLTPLVVASWPAISAAVFGAAAAMGYAVGGTSCAPTRTTNTTSVETEIENSEVISEELVRGLHISLEKDGVHIEFGQDERGACTVCVTGEGRTKKQLKRIGEEVAGRMVQQFAYHKLVSELKRRNYAIVDEQVLRDQSVQVRVRL